MALQETAQKTYARYGGDPEIAYKSRRFSIRQQLPHLTGSQLQKRLNDLDEEIAVLKNENVQFKLWIRQIKRDGSVNAYLDRMHRTLSESHLGMLELRLDTNKTALEWMHRERRIYRYEVMKRKLEAVQLPVVRLKLAGLQKKAADLEVDIEKTSAKLKRLQKEKASVDTEAYKAEQKILKLDFTGA